jgi:diketogulonate reductase-like aldo/keto reductase
MTGIRTIRLPCGEPIPVLGQGIWRMREDPARWDEELAALRLGLDLGLTPIDTAEMYAGGGAEKLVGEAIAGRCDEVFLVSKVMPANASRRGTINACVRSLRRLRTDRLDPYLIPWPAVLPVKRTIEALVELVDTGKIRHWDVSNFDVIDLAGVMNQPGGVDVQVNQMPTTSQGAGSRPSCFPGAATAGSR